MARLLMLLLVLIPFASCKAAQGDRCAKSEDCGSGLVCFAPTEAQGSFIKAMQYKELEPYLDAYTCVTPEDLAEAAQAYGVDRAIAEEKAAKERAISEAKTAQARCRASISCKAIGSCTAKDGRCKATSDADCRASTIACKDNGHCTAKDGTCVVTSDADCRASEGCKKFGQCTLEDGWCVK